MPRERLCLIAFPQGKAAEEGRDITEAFIIGKFGVLHATQNKSKKPRKKASTRLVSRCQHDTTAEGIAQRIVDIEAVAEEELLQEISTPLEVKHEEVMVVAAMVVVVMVLFKPALPLHITLLLPL